MAEHLDGLDAVNRKAWRLYQQCARRFAADLHAGGTVLERMTREMDAETFGEMWERLALFYDVLQPPPEPPKKG